MNRQSLRSLLLFLLACGFAIPAPEAAGNEQPNVVIILVDDMGFGDPGCYNPESRIPTPRIDQLAREGMRFTDAHAPGPLCHVSRYGLLTGRYPWRQPIRWNNEVAIRPDQLTLPQFLRDQGYATHMVGKWHLGFHEDPAFEKPLRGGPVDRGFDSFFGIRASTDIPPYFYIRDRKAVQPPTLDIEANNTEGWSPIQGKFWRAGKISPDLKLEEVLPRFTEEAIGVIKRHAQAEKDQPLLLYLAYPAPHTPWLPTAEFEGKSGAGLYGDFTCMVDAQVGQVLDALKDHALDQETIVCFLSDNGPTWYDRDVERFGHDSAGGFRGMKADAWEAGHRVPFMVRWPGKVKPGSVSDQLICFTDLFCTLGEITGGAIPPTEALDSISFLDVLMGRESEPESRRQTLVTAASRGHIAVRSGSWKLITGPGSGGFSGGPNQPGPGVPAGQLYNLQDDRGERTNLYEQMPDQVTQLRQLWQQIQDRAER